MVWYLVRWETGCSVTVSGTNYFGSDWERRRWEIGLRLAGISSVEMGCTLGCDCTLGAIGVPGVAVLTLGARCFRVDRVRRGSLFEAVGSFVSPAQ